MSLHGLTGSMTSWKYTYHLLLLVLLSTIDWSKENCVDYISNGQLANNVNRSILLVMKNDPKDAIECTAWRECQVEKKCHIINQCFNGLVETQTEKCKGETREISYHHYLCLLFKFSEYIDKRESHLKACEYETTCKIYSESSSTVFHQTSFPPPTTTLPERTTAVATAPSTPPKTTTASTTTTATTTTPATKTITTTTATTTPKTTTTTTTTTTRVTQSTYKGSNGVTSQLKNENNNTEDTALKTFLVISVLLNIGLFVYLLTWHHRTKQYCIHQCVNCERSGASSEAQQVTEMESSAPQASVDQSEIETSHLMKSNECVDVITQSSDERTGCTVEMQQ